MDARRARRGTRAELRRARTALLLAGSGLTVLLWAPACAVRQGNTTVVRRADLGLSFPLPAGFREADPAERSRMAPDGGYLALGPATRRYHANVGVQAKPLPPGVPAPDMGALGPQERAEMHRMMEMDRRQTHPSYRIEKGIQGSVAGQGAYFVDGVYAMPEVDGLVRHRSAYVARGGRLYMITLSAHADAFPGVVREFDALLGGLRWEGG